MNSRLVRAASLLAVLSLGCRGIVAGDCTEIGCSSGLQVSFATQPTVAYKVEVNSGAGGATYTFDCPDPTRCSEAFFPDYVPSHVVITVTTLRGSQRTEATPQYQVHEPNGASCPPRCRNGQVTVEFP